MEERPGRQNHNRATGCFDVEENAICDCHVPLSCDFQGRRSEARDDMEPKKKIPATGLAQRLTLEETCQKKAKRLAV